MEPDGHAPYSVKLHQADAEELVKSNAILLILGVPPGTTFGLNTQVKNLYTSEGRIGT
jgi:hypothetical protein